VAPPAPGTPPRVTRTPIAEVDGHLLDVEVPPGGEGHIGVLNAVLILPELLALLGRHVAPVTAMLFCGIKDQVRLTQEVLHPRQRRKVLEERAVTTAASRRA
jgi:hypothetical protein